jgi:2-dehydropantoate 2-reductase
LAGDAEAEARRVLDAAGIAYIGDEEEAAARAVGFRLKPVAGVDDQFVGGSTWQSLQRGTGNIETDYLNGEVVMIAHRIGMEAPINEQLAILARQAAVASAKPGDISVEQLAGLCGGSDDSSALVPHAAWDVNAVMACMPCTA